MLLPLLLASLPGPGSAKSLFEESGEFLPEDTFRKLAAVLYRRGDKMENRLSRKFLYNTNVTCNDGTAAGYYIRRSPASRRWIIYLEGGWFCYDQTSCEARWLRLKTLMSSDRWPEVKTVGGILSSDSQENPHFADANHVLVPYCSSDSWSGTAARTVDQRFAFLGAEILTEVVKELFSWEQLGGGRELYLVGSSAGGTGVLVNLDAVAGLVRSLGSTMRVRGIVDSGWFLDNDPFSSSSRTKASFSPSQTVSVGAHLWKARVPDSCAQHFPGEEWKCFFGYRIYPTIRTPVFIFQWQFDEAQMTADNVGAPVTQAQWNFIHHQGRNIRRTLEPVSAVFAPSCISHTVMTKPSWVSVTVSGVSLPDALQCWVSQSQPGELELGSQSNILRPVQNDDPAPAPQLTLKRINSNMLKSMKKYNGSHKLRHRDVLDNRTNKRMRKRGRRNRKSCRYGDNLEERIRCAQEESAALYLHPDRRNRDLLRKLEKREPQQRQPNKKRRRRRKRRQRSESESYPRRLTREDRKRLKRERRRKLKLQALRERRRREKLRHGKNSEAGRRKEKSVSVRSIPMMSPPGRCPQRHVDTCSWPQCNRSCPKLHNPLTGEEMDFLELLESFGLDMKSVAQALGIDISTLNNMDKDVLLHLLTSQTNVN